MKSIRALFMLLLLALPILACGGGANEEPTATAAAVEIVPTNTAEPTATPAPTNTPEPTATPAPTNTPEPTATPEPTGPVIPDDFQLLESTEGGIAIYYPDGWVSDDFLGIITLASNEVLLDSADPGAEGALAVIVSDSIETDLGLPITPEDGALAVLNAILADPSSLDLGTDFEVIKPAEQVDAVNEGHDVASAVAQATSENGIRVAYVLKIIITDTRFALFGGTTPAETIEQYEEILDTIGNSIALSEPAGEDTDTPPVSTEAVPVVLGDVIEGEITEDLAQYDYLYTAAAGETLVVAVVPETDDQDLTLAIYAANDFIETLVDVDDGSSGEGETLVYTFATAGDYIIRVAEFGYPDAGLFFLSIDEITSLVIGTTEGTLPDGESKLFYFYEATSGESLTFTLTPGNADMDVVIKIYRADDMESVVAEIDGGFFGDPEVLTYTFVEAGKYLVEISEYFGMGGNVIFEVTE